MRVQVITLFPDMLEGYFRQSMMQKAQKEGCFDLAVVNLRDFGLGPRRQVDDTPYGGGDGMVLKPEPLVKAIEYAQSQASGNGSRVILMTPRGNNYVQAAARRLAESGEELIFVCARYEGYDERIVDYVDEQISIGDYVLTGGELPAMVVIDSVVRLLPGVLGGEKSAELESFSDGKTREHPHYTRPETFRGKKVPEILLSGNHAQVEAWRNRQSKTT